MYENIVVGTDGSASAAQAVHHAVRLAEMSGAKLHLVQAVPPAVAIDPSGMAAGTSYIEQAIVDAETDITRLATSASERGVAATGRVCPTGAADALIDVAEEVGADLLVVGSRGMTGARRLLLGSVPNAVSHHAPCSVLIVRTT